jgi:hypothetical protein
MTDEGGRDGAVVLGLVAPSGMPRELADQLAAELPGELGNHLEPADIRDASALSAATTALADRLGPVEVLEYSPVPDFQVRLGID